MKVDEMILCKVEVQTKVAAPITLPRTPTMGHPYPSGSDSGGERLNGSLSNQASAFWMFVLAAAHLL